MNKNYIDYIRILSIFSIVILFIISYYIFYISKFYDMINNDILSSYVPFISDYWAISHIILFFIITYLFPKRYIFITICGIIWEIIEHFTRYIINIYYNKKILNHRLSKKLDLYVEKRKKNINTPNVSQQNNEPIMIENTFWNRFIKPDNWWYGRPEDIIYNGIGTTIALLVRSLK